MCVWGVNLDERPRTELIEQARLALNLKRIKRESVCVPRPNAAALVRLGQELIHAGHGPVHRARWPVGRRRHLLRHLLLHLLRVLLVLRLLGQVGDVVVVRDVRHGSAGLRVRKVQRRLARAW